MTTTWIRALSRSIWTGQNLCPDSSRLVRGRILRRVTAQPWDKLVEAELVCFVKVSDEFISLLGVRCEARAIDGEKSIRRGESRPLVAVDKGTVLREALPERCGFLDQVSVITGLRSVEGGFQQPLIPDAVGAAIAFDQVGMHGQHFRHGEIVGHSASFL